MLNELEGKVAIVTGGSGSIGSAAAELFAEEGAKVVIADVNVEAGEELAERLGSPVRFKRVDVAKREEVQELVEFAIAEFGDLDVMFNNAGIPGQMHNRFSDDPLEDFDRVMHINLLGVMYGSQFAARHMIPKRSGSIINTTSIAGTQAGYSIFAFRAAKAGVVSFSQSLAIDLGEYQIRVNSIAPGHIPNAITTFADTDIPPERFAEMQKAMEPIWMMDQPLKRKGAPRDVANLAMFLASDRSTQITGQVIAVDGGVTCGNALNQNAMLKETRERFLASA